MVQKNTQDIEEGAGIFLKLKKEIKKFFIETVINLQRK